MLVNMSGPFIGTVVGCQPPQPRGHLLRFYTRQLNAASAASAASFSSAEPMLMRTPSSVKGRTKIAGLWAARCATSSAVRSFASIHTKLPCGSGMDHPSAVERGDHPAAFRDDSLDALQQFLLGLEGSERRHLRHGGDGERGHARARWRRAPRRAQRRSRRAGPPVRRPWTWCAGRRRWGGLPRHRRRCSRCRSRRRGVGTNST